MSAEFQDAIKRLNDIDSYGCLNTTSLGELCVFPLIVRDMMALESEFGRPVSEVGKEVYLRSYLRFTCYPKESLTSGKFKPEKPVLSPDDVEQLTHEEIDALAGLICGHEKQLWSELVLDQKEDGEGKTILSSRTGERVHEKGPDESDSDFLFRLLTLQDEKMRSRRERLLGTSLFSSELGQKIKETIGIGDMLRRSFEPVATSDKVVPPTFEPNLELRDRKAELLAEISARLNALIDHTQASTTFAVTANELQMQIASEIKRSSDQSSLDSQESIKVARDNLLLTKWVICLTFCSILFPLLLALKGQADAIADGIKSTAQMEQNVSLISSEISALADAVKSTRQRELTALEGELRGAKNAIESLEAANKRLQQLRESDAKAIQELQREHQRPQNAADKSAPTPQGDKTQ